MLLRTLLSTSQLSNTAQRRHMIQLKKHIDCVKSVHSNCQSLKDLQHLLDPSLSQNTHIPDILRRDALQYSNRTQWLSDHAKDQLPANTFEDRPMPSSLMLRQLYEGNADE